MQPTRFEPLNIWRIFVNFRRYQLWPHSVQCMYSLNTWHWFEYGPWYYYLVSKVGFKTKNRHSPMIRIDNLKNLKNLIGWMFSERPKNVFNFFYWQVNSYEKKIDDTRSPHVSLNLTWCMQFIQQLLNSTCDSIQTNCPTHCLLLIKCYFVFVHRIEEVHRIKTVERFPLSTLSIFSSFFFFWRLVSERFGRCFEQT